MTPLKQNCRKWLLGSVPLLIAVLVFAVFSRSLGGQFLNWDDDWNFFFTTGYRGLGWANLKWMFTTFGIGPYSPLMWLTAGVDHSIWGLNPFGWHLTNVLMHCGNAALFYILCIRLLTISLPALEDSKRIALSAGLAALLFALHPLKVEPAAWISDRPDLLQALFYQLAVLSYISWRPGGKDTVSWWRRQALPLSLFLLALLAKGTAVTLPLVLILLDIYPLGRLNPDFRRWSDTGNRGLLLEKFPYFALSLAFGVVAVIGQHKAGTILPLEGLGPGPRAAQVLQALMFYPMKTILPLHLVPFYQPDSGLGALSWQSLLSAAALIFVTAAAIAARHRRPAVTAVWAYYLLTVWPMAGFLKVHEYWAADRYAYLPSLGFFVLAGAWILGSLRSESGVWRKIRLAGVCILLAMFTALTWRQQGVWRNSESLWRYAISVYPDIWVSQNNLGNALIVTGRPEEAIAHFRKALRLQPDSPEIHYNLGMALAALGRPEEAMSHFREALRLKPDFPEVHTNLGIILSAFGRPEEAISHFREALRLKPDYPEAHNNWGLALAALGRPEEAVSHYREALRFKSDYPEAHINWGADLAAFGRFEEAISHYREALRLKPDYPAAHVNWGADLAAFGRFEEAISHYREALRLKPDYPEAHNNWGADLAALGRFEEAISHYREALRLRPDYPNAKENLALALAALGRTKHELRKR